MCRWSGGTVVVQRSQRSSGPSGDGLRRLRLRQTAKARHHQGPAPVRDGLVESASQRDLDLLLLAQQRDRLELEVVVVHGPARPGAGSMCARSPDSASAPPSSARPSVSPPQPAHVLR